ncbi:MAG: hypothetical protein CVV58_07585 [Tenericutes bacterium HGW-Tenericutes-3]|nr:MAG: hypothetical protein CVV58_07585 [Tenericutes bacterium HGW-Tenericutes-3]
MKKNEVNEENMFQKYDDLFADQDKKYDKNNTDRYAKKKNVRSEDVDYQRYVKKEKEPQTVNKNMFIVGVIVVLMFGFMIFAITNIEVLKEIPSMAIIGGLAIISTFFRKNKRK